jgi:hypothetical protein
MTFTYNKVSVCHELTPSFYKKPFGTDYGNPVAGKNIV